MDPAVRTGARVQINVLMNVFLNDLHRCQTTKKRAHLSFTREQTTWPSRTLMWSVKLSKQSPNFKVALQTGPLWRQFGSSDLLTDCSNPPTGWTDGDTEAIAPKSNTTGPPFRFPSPDPGKTYCFCFLLCVKDKPLSCFVATPLWYVLFWTNIQILHLFFFF